MVNSPDDSLDLLFEDDEFDFDLEDIDLDDLVDSEIFEQDEEEEFLDIADRINRLSDRLSEDIILRNIEAQLNSKIDPLVRRTNYVTLFRKKINSINKNSALYSKEYIDSVCLRVKDLLLPILEEKYSIGIGNESDFYFPIKCIEDLENIYEFFFIRHYENVVKYICFMIRKLKPQIMEKFEPRLSNPDYMNDIFLVTLQKKFSDTFEVLVLHFLDEIINMVIERFDSAFDLFKDICALEPYETVSMYIDKMLDDYGMSIVFLNDKDAYTKYFSILDTKECKNEIISDVKMKFVENCSLSEESKNINSYFDEEENG